ncbi:MAG: hypothetical protein K2N35_11730 [Muribaculaceae bacterium]|nr:hypothetical protein [Muribaculaceae bacterium]
MVDAPKLSQQILALIERVEKLNKDEVKLAFIPDQRMKSDKIGGRNFKIGRRALLMLKQATGISKYNTRKNLKRQWNEFRKEVRGKNEDK